MHWTILKSLMFEYWCIEFFNLPPISTYNKYTHSFPGQICGRDLVLSCTVTDIPNKHETYLLQHSQFSIFKSFQCSNMSSYICFGIILKKNVENFVGQIFVFYDSRLIPYHAVKFYGAKLGLSNGLYIPPPSSHIYDP